MSGAQTDDERLRCRAFGRELAHPLGLAAGFDKNGVALDNWESLGFSFAEIGTVTPRAQAGNPKPRIFRLPEDDALINRLGFNNDGVEAMAERLEARQTSLPIGVNIGMNADTPLESAVEDYVYCLRRVRGLCDYIAINVSSPNTPGLRELQREELLPRMLETLSAEAGGTPLFLKISPDLSDDDVRRVAELAVEHGISGLIATNTTVARDGLHSRASSEEGGLSGRPLAQRAGDVCRLVRDAGGERLEIIGVGGIFTGNDLYDRLSAGADICQSYTAFVYRGPKAASLTLNELLTRMQQECVAGLQDVCRSSRTKT